MIFLLSAPVSIPVAHSLHPSSSIYVEKGKVNLPSSQHSYRRILDSSIDSRFREVLENVKKNKKSISTFLDSVKGKLGFSLGSEYASYSNWFDGLSREVEGYFSSALTGYLSAINFNAQKWADRVAGLRSHDNLDRQLSELIGKFNGDSSRDGKKVWDEVKKKFSDFGDRFEVKLKEISKNAKASDLKLDDLSSSTEIEDIEKSPFPESLVTFSDKIRSEVFKEWFKSRTDLSRNLVFRNYSLLPRSERIQAPKGFYDRRVVTPRKSAIGFALRSNVQWSELSNGKFTLVPQYSPFS